MKKFRLIHGLAVFLPIIVICGWIGSYLIHLERGDTYELPITGFDPRDLLSGHYLRYQVNYGPAIACKSEGIPWCVCLGRKGDIAYAESQGLCSQVNCAQPLIGHCKGRRFTAGIERFYFPEQFKKELAVVPPKSTIIVSIDKSGQGVVKDLRVDGEPVREWLSRQMVSP